MKRRTRELDVLAQRDRYITQQRITIVADTSCVLLEPASDDTCAHTADDITALFRGKVSSVRASTTTTPPYYVPSRSTPTLDNWTPVTTDEHVKLIASVPCKTCQLDPVPAWIVKHRKALFSPFVTILFNKSLAVGCFPSDFKKPWFAHC